MTGMRFFLLLFVMIILYELPCSKRNVNSFLTNTNEAVLCKCTWNAGWGVCKISFNSFFKAREDEKWDFRLCFKSYVIFLHLFLFPSTCWIIFIPIQEWVNSLYFQANLKSYALTTYPFNRQNYKTLKERKKRVRPPDGAHTNSSNASRKSCNIA